MGALGRFPATPGMVGYLHRARALGYRIYAVTGRKAAYKNGTLANLRTAGYGDLFDASTLFTRWTGKTPSYLSCATATCTTVEYKAGTRRHLERDLGVDVITDLGDQWSDLMGGYADRVVKLPNPMYAIDAPNLPGVRQPQLAPRNRFTMLPDGSSGTSVGGEGIPNVDRVTRTIAVYYGDPGTGIANRTRSPYVAELTALAAQQRRTLAHRYALALARGERPALVFDVDDTTLWSYDLVAAGMDFDVDRAGWDTRIQQQRFAATPAMVALVGDARQMGYTIFGLTERTDTQLAATLANLRRVGYPADAFVADRFFTTWTGTHRPPSYVHCAAATCTTAEYKTQTRAHLERDLGYRIVADFGDQPADLAGGYADRPVPLPNPTYDLP